MTVIENDLICPKCGHKRVTLGDVPQWQCPNCGVAYEKLTKVEMPQEELGKLNKDFIEKNKRKNIMKATYKHLFFGRFCYFR